MVTDVYRSRLSLMMFGQFLIMGSWVVTLATYLMSSPLKGGLNFPPSYASYIYSTLAIAGIIAPVFIGVMADRLFAAEKLTGCFHLFGAILLATAAWWCLQQQPRIEAAYRTAAAREFVEGVPVVDMEAHFIENPEIDTPELRQELKEAFVRVNRSPEVAERLQETLGPLFLVMLGYAFCNIITLTLCNVIAFRNLHDPQKSFGVVRLFGTVGWITSGVQLELFWNTISPAPLFLAAGFSVAFGLYCFTLPSTPPSAQHKSLSEALGLPALSMFRERSFIVLIVCSLGIGVVQQFYTIYTNRFLGEIHAPYPTALQTIAQVSEVIAMLLVPALILRLGLKLTMALGLVCWTLRYGMFATQSLPVVLLAGLPMCGMSYTFFVIVGSMYVDRRALLRLRASAQAIYTFICMGAGTLLGNWLSGVVVESQTAGDLIAWPNVWLVPASISAAILLVYLALFRESAPAPVRLPIESR